MPVQLNGLMRYMTSVLAALFLMCALVRAQARHTVTPKDGFVPDQETAIRVAEAVLVPIYGADKIDQEKPFVAELRNGVWLVSGTLHRNSSDSIKKGGVTTIEIAKMDGKVLRVSHGK